MNQDTCVQISENISLKKEDDPSETTVQNRTMRHRDSTCQSSTTSNLSNESNTAFKHMKPNISTGEESNLKMNTHMLQQESTCSSIWPSTTCGAQNVLTPTNTEINVSTAEYTNMMLGQNIFETDKDSSKESEGIFSEIIENTSVVPVKNETRDLGTSKENDLNVLINDEIGDQTAIAEKEKTPENVRDNLENTTGMVTKNVENAQDDKKSSEEITDKFIKSSSLNEGDKLVEGDEDLYNITGVDKENEGQTELFNAASLEDKEGSPTSHHKTTVACGDGSIVAHQLSCETCVTIGASGKVNYTMFPNAGSQSGHTLHQGTRDDQLLRYFEDVLHESMTTVCSSPFKENQEDNLDDFVEISLEEKGCSHTSTERNIETPSISKSHGKLSCLNKCFKRFCCITSNKS